MASCTALLSISIRTSVSTNTVQVANKPYVCLLKSTKLKLPSWAKRFLARELVLKLSCSPTRESHNNC